MRRLARYTAVFIITLFAVYLFWFFRTVIGLFVASLALAALFRPMFHRLHRRGVSRGLALALTYAGLIAVFTIGGWWLVPILLEESQALVSFIAVEYELRWDNKEDFPQWQMVILNMLPNPENFYASLAGTSETPPPDSLVNSLNALGTLLGSLPIVIMLSIYWASGQEQFERLWLSLLTAPRRRRARELWRRAENTLGAYLRSELFQVVASFFLLAIGFYMLEYPYPILLSLIASLLLPLPLFGSPLAILLVVLCSIFQRGSTTLMAATLTAIVHLFLFAVVEPRLIKQWQYNPFLALFIIILLVENVGFVGLFMAPPLAALIQIILRTVFLRQEGIKQTESLDELSKRLESVEVAFDKETPAQVVSVIERLENLIAQAKKKTEPA